MPEKALKEKAHNTLLLHGYVQQFENPNVYIDGENQFRLEGKDLPGSELRFFTKLGDDPELELQNYYHFENAIFWLHKAKLERMESPY